LETFRVFIEQEKKMKVGYAQNTITPSLDKPVFMAGFGNNRRAETIHDDLYARALAVQDDKSTLVLVALDLIGFFRHDVYNDGNPKGLGDL
jgi:hypothetical protein